jgi:hypothetical protein
MDVRQKNGAKEFLQEGQSLDFHAQRFISLALMPNESMQANLQPLKMTPREQSTTEFYVDAHCIRLLARYEQVFTPEESGLSLRGAFHFFRETINGEFVDIDERILFNRLGVFKFSDGEEMELGGPGDPYSRMSIAVHFLRIIQSQIKSAPAFP